MVIAATHIGRKDMLEDFRVAAEPVAIFNCQQQTVICEHSILRQLTSLFNTLQDIFPV